MAISLGIYMTLLAIMPCRDAVGLDMIGNKYNTISKNYKAAEKLAKRLVPLLNLCLLFYNSHGRISSGMRKHFGSAKR